MSASNRDLLAILEEQLKYTLCVSLSKATRGDIFNAVALAIRHFQQDQFSTVRLVSVRQRKNAFIISQWSFCSASHYAII